MPICLRYSKKIEELSRFHYNNLGEKQRRHYAASEALKLGYGGISYMSSVLDIERNTIFQGIKELKVLDPSDTTVYNRQRKIGGGRKKRLI